MLVVCNINFNCIYILISILLLLWFLFLIIEMIDKLDFILNGSCFSFFEYYKYLSST